MPLLCEETKKLAKHAPQSPCLSELNELTSTTILFRDVFAGSDPDFDAQVEF